MNIRNDPNLKSNIIQIIKDTTSDYYDLEYYTEDSFKLINDIIQIPYQKVTIYIYSTKHYLPYYNRVYTTYYDDNDIFDLTKLFDIYDIRYEIEFDDDDFQKIEFNLPMLMITFDTIVFEDFSNLRNLYQTHDVKLINKNETFNVSLFLLLARGGEYFKSNLSFKLDEKTFLLDFSSQAINVYISYLYSGDKYLSENQIPIRELYYLADYLICRPLTTMIYKLIQDGLFKNDSYTIQQVETIKNIDPILQELIYNNNNVTLVDYILNYKEDKVWYYGPLVLKNRITGIRYFKTRVNDNLFMIEIRNLITELTDNSGRELVVFDKYVREENFLSKFDDKKILSKYKSKVRFEPIPNHSHWFRFYNFFFYNNNIDKFTLMGKLPYRKFELTTPTFEEMSYFSKFESIKFYDYIIDGYINTEFLRNILS